MQFELPRRHRKSFEVTTRKKLSEKFNRIPAAKKV